MSEISQSDLARIVDVVGEGYMAGLELVPEALLPRRIVRAAPGVDGASNLLSDDDRACVFEACMDGTSELILDFGGEVVGIPEWHFGDGSSGTLHVEYGEDLRECLDEIGEPFQQDFLRFQPNSTCTTHRRRAFRFVRISARGRYGRISLRALRLHSCMKRLPRLGYFRSSEPLVDAIWRAAVNTVHACMQGYLEDGVKRDCCLWAGDLRPAGLAALYAFGDAAYIAHNLRAFVPWRYREGAIPPMVGHSYVMYDYVAWWTIAVHDYFQYTGDVAFAREMFPIVADQVRFLQKRRTARGLVNVQLEYDAPFTDWTCPKNRVGEVTFVQALYRRMLLDAASLADVIGEAATAAQWRDEAETVRQAANRYLWSEELGTFADFRREEILSRRTSEDGLALAVLFGLAEGERAAAALDRLREKHWTPYGSLHLDRPYLEDEPDYVKTLHGNYIAPMINGYEIAAHFSQDRVADGLELARRCFGNMIRQGATTFWESVDLESGRMASAAGSQCHSWTGLIAYLLQSYVLGIRPATPGFQTCLVSPHVGPLGMAAGVVPTPNGLVAVQLEQLLSASERRLVVKCSTPNTVAPVAILRPTRANTRVRLDGKLLFEDGEWRGEHRGCVLGEHGLTIPMEPGNHVLTMDNVERDFSFLPRPLAKNLYVPGSLRRTSEGFSFEIRGDVTNFPLTGLQPILLDDEEFATYTVAVPPSEKVGRYPSLDRPVLVSVGQTAEVRVQCEPPEPGTHRLQFSIQTGWWHAGTVTVFAEDII